jgi:PsbP
MPACLHTLRDALRLCQLRERMAEDKRSQYKVWPKARGIDTCDCCCGRQEVSVGGQDVVYKDIIEPLESVSIAITPSDKDDITLYGEPLDVSTLQSALSCCTWMQARLAYCHLNVTCKQVEA